MKESSPRNSILATMSLYFGVAAVILFVLSLFFWRWHGDVAMLAMLLSTLPAIGGVILGIAGFRTIRKGAGKFRGTARAITGVCSGVLLLTFFLCGVVQLSSSGGMPKVIVAKDQVRNFQVALDLYLLDNGFYPTTAQGLSALIAQPTTPPLPPNWKSPYLRPTILRNDPWGSPYSYTFPAVRSTNSFDLVSPGPNKILGDADDIGNW